MVLICAVGTGHVGLVYSVAFGLDGHEVTGADVDAREVSNMKERRPTFFESGLLEALADARKTGRLSFSTDVPGSTLPAIVAKVKCAKCGSFEEQDAALRLRRGGGM